MFRLHLTSSYFSKTESGSKSKLNSLETNGSWPSWLLKYHWLYLYIPKQCRRLKERQGKWAWKTRRRKFFLPSCTAVRDWVHWLESNLKSQWTGREHWQCHHHHQHQQWEPHHHYCVVVGAGIVVLSFLVQVLNPLLPVKLETRTPPELNESSDVSKNSREFMILELWNVEWLIRA